MSAMTDSCQALEAEFVWGAQLCRQPAIQVVEIDGREFGVCEVHAERVDS